MQKNWYYKLQDLICPRNSIRRDIARFIYRFPRQLTKENMKKSKKYINKYGVKKFIKYSYNDIINKPTASRKQELYEKWIKNNEPNNFNLEEQKKYKFKINPKISIIVPMYNTKEIFLKQLIDCIKNQTYSNWELCLADASEKKLDYTDKYINNDERIVYKFLNKNEGIAENSNEAIKLSTGDYIILLDHDDLLPVFCLYEIVKYINANVDTEFIYTDEDKIINKNNNRFDPHFKPDYSPDTLKSYNYITHLSIFKRNLLDKLGGFKSGYNGAQDYDIILRATEIANKVGHIPKILYHWRVHNNSTAYDSSSKLYAYESGIKAITDSLKRLNIEGSVVNANLLGYYRVKYKIIGNPLVSIIIPNKDNIEDLDKCIKSIKKSTYKNYEIIIVENNSEIKSTFEYYKNINDKNIKVAYYSEKVFNYSKINNYGVTFASGDYILLLNNDIEVISKNWLEEMLSICQRNDVGIVGAKLLYPDNTVQHAGVIVGIGGVAGHINKLIKDTEYGYYLRASVINNFSSVTAACMLVKKDLYNKVNGLSEEFKVAFNDIDFCLKVRELNKLVVYTPYAKLYHYESKSRGYEDTPEKIKRFECETLLFRNKWKKVLDDGDPYFNKNFRLDTHEFIINSEEIDYE